MLSQGKPKVYWFPAKRYGWGWGMPAGWHGRLVLALFFVLIGLGGWLLLPSYGPAIFVVYCVVLCLALIWICWMKGEPPKWRWGQE